MSTLYEIIELPNGDIALQRADEKGEPLVSIRFSKESLYFLNESRFDIARAMIEAGLEAANTIDEDEQEEDSEESDSDSLIDGLDMDSELHTVH